MPKYFVYASGNLVSKLSGLPATENESVSNRALSHHLADAAYDADLIKEYSYSLEHVPIIEPGKRNGKDDQMAPAKRIRYRERTVAERAFSNLKDNYDGRFLRVKDASKVIAHLMFGVLALTATQLFRLLE